MRAEQGSSRALQRLLDGGSELQALLRARKQGNPEARKIMADVVLHLGVAIAHVAATYDPSLVVLQGEIFPPLLEEMEEVARKAVPWLPRLAISQLGEDAALEGAIVAARAQAYEQIAKALGGEAVPHPRRVDWWDSERDELSHSGSAAGP
jgi:predicted NBD/HSP70 family sugar kinase